MTISYLWFVLNWGKINNKQPDPAECAVCLANLVYVFVIYAVKSFNLFVLSTLHVDFIFIYFLSTLVCLQIDRPKPTCDFDTTDILPPKWERMRDHKNENDNESFWTPNQNEKDMCTTVVVFTVA